MTRIEHERRLMDLLAVASDDEVQVIARFVQRIHNARREYGPLRMKRDTRDYRHEAAAEAFDALAYLCMEDVRRGVEQEPRFQGLPRGSIQCGQMLLSGGREFTQTQWRAGQTLCECAHGVLLKDECAKCLAAAERVRTILKQREG